MPTYSPDGQHIWDEENQRWLPAPPRQRYAPAPAPDDIIPAQERFRPNELLEATVDRLRALPQTALIVAAAMGVVAIGTIAIAGVSGHVKAEAAEREHSELTGAVATAMATCYRDFLGTHGEYPADAVLGQDAISEMRIFNEQFDWLIATSAVPDCVEQDSRFQCEDHSDAVSALNDLAYCVNKTDEAATQTYWAVVMASA